MVVGWFVLSDFVSVPIKRGFIGRGRNVAWDVFQEDLIPDQRMF